MEKISKQTEQKIIELYLQNFSLKEIAKLTGVHTSTVSSVRKRNNLPFKELGIISNNEKDKIIDLYNSGKSIEQIAKIYKCSHNTISWRLKKWNVQFREYNIDKYYPQAVELFKQGYSLTKIEKLLHIAHYDLSKRLQNDGFEVKNLWNECKFNANIFDSIDTEEKAYWLGFIFADGYIASKGKTKQHYNFELSLKGDDVNHLYKFQKFVECSSEKVKVSQVKCGDKLCTRCRICLTNKHFWETLNSYGCTPKKSLTLKFPNVDIFKSKDLIRHFIRGYVDGDGSIGLYKRPEFSCLGTYDFLTSMLTYLEPRNLSENSKGNPNTLVFGFSGTKATAYLYNLYYKSNIYLDRKFQIFNKIKDCRFKVKALKLLEDKIREGWDANPELIADLKDLQQCNA